MYIIEDTETSSWTKTTGYGYPANYGIYSKKSVVNCFSILTHWLNREFLREKQKKKQKNHKNQKNQKDQIRKIRKIMKHVGCRLALHL